MFYGFAILTVIEKGLYAGETNTYRRAFRVDRIMSFWDNWIVVSEEGEFDGMRFRVKESFDEIREAILNSFVAPQFQIPPYPVFT